MNQVKEVDFMQHYVKVLTRQCEYLKLDTASEQFEQTTSELYNELVGLLKSTGLNWGTFLTDAPSRCKVVRSKNFQVFYNIKTEQIHFTNKFF